LVHSLYGGDEGGKLDSKFRGYKYSISLDYSSYASADMLMQLRPILGAGKDDRVILVPRIDAPQFQFNVMLTSAFTLSKRRNEGYKRPIFAFKSKENVLCYGTIDGHGTNYGQNYGSTGW
jgi:hypothetical protein